jgi:cytochrome P450
MLNKSFISDILSFLFDKIVNEFETTFKLWLGSELFLIIRDPDDIKTVYNSENCFDKVPMYQLIGLPDGMLAIGGDKYKVHRKLLNPAFNPKMLKTFMPLIDKNSRRFVLQLDKHLNGDEFDMLHEVDRFSLENIVETLFGLTNVPEKVFTKYLENVSK